MASQKVTFSLPKDLVRRFASRVPARQRSRYAAEALPAKLSERDQMLARACEIVNGHEAIRALEREWDAVTDEIEEPCKRVVLDFRGRSTSMPPARGTAGAKAGMSFRINNESTVD